MAQKIKIPCPNCNREFEVVLEYQKIVKKVGRGSEEHQLKTKIETYHGRCPYDGTWVVHEIVSEE